MLGLVLTDPRLNSSDSFLLIPFGTSPVHSRPLLSIGTKTTKPARMQSEASTDFFFFDWTFSTIPLIKDYGLLKGTRDSFFSGVMQIMHVQSGGIPPSA